MLLLPYGESRVDSEICPDEFPFAVAGSAFCARSCNGLRSGVEDVTLMKPVVSVKTRLSILGVLLSLREMR